MTNKVDKRPYTLEDVKRAYPGFGQLKNLNAAKLYDGIDQLLAAVNAIDLTSKFLIGYQVPYVTPVLQAVHFISNLVRPGVAWGTIPASAPIEQCLAHPLAQSVSNILKSPTATRVCSGAQLVGSVKGTAFKIANYIHASERNNAQNPLTGLLLHAFNLGCQASNTISDFKNSIK